MKILHFASLYPFLTSQLRITTGNQSMQSMICEHAILKTSCVIILSKRIAPILSLRVSSGLFIICLIISLGSSLLLLNMNVHYTTPFTFRSHLHVQGVSFQSFWQAPAPSLFNGILSTPLPGGLRKVSTEPGSFWKDAPNIHVKLLVSSIKQTDICIEREGYYLTLFRLLFFGLIRVRREVNLSAPLPYPYSRRCSMRM